MVYSFIESVIDSFRTAKKIKSSFADSSILTITLPDLANYYTDYLNFSQGDYVTISGTGQTDLVGQVTDITGSTLTLVNSFGVSDATLANYENVTLNRPYYSYEKWMGEANALTIQEINARFASERFPRFFLLLDQNYSFSRNSVIRTNSLNLYIFAKTKPRERANWRWANIYETVLNPLAETFVRQLENNKKFVYNENMNITREDLFYLGTADKNQNKLNSYVDAVRLEINDLIFTNPNNC